MSCHMKSKNEKAAGNSLLIINNSIYIISNRPSYFIIMFTRWRHLCCCFEHKPRGVHASDQLISKHINFSADIF